MPLLNFFYSTKAVAKKHAQKKLYSLFEGNKDHPILFLSSGGSALALLDKKIIKSDWSRFTISVVDDRFSKDYLINNFLQLQQTPLYISLIRFGARSISTVPLRSETLEQYGKRYENLLRIWKKENPTGIVIITLGMGEDSHTAGIMPGLQKDEYNTFLEKDRWIVSYNVGEKNKYKERISLTTYFLRSYVDHAVVYIVGGSKQKAFNQLIANRGDIITTPIRIIHEMKDVNVYTDL